MTTVATVDHAAFVSAIEQIKYQKRIIRRLIISLVTLGLMGVFPIIDLWNIYRFINVGNGIALTARDLKEACEINLPRTQTCRVKLIAVPVTRS